MHQFRLLQHVRAKSAVPGRNSGDSFPLSPVIYTILGWSYFWPIRRCLLSKTSLDGHSKYNSSFFSKQSEHIRFCWNRKWNIARPRAGHQSIVGWSAGCGDVRVTVSVIRAEVTRYSLSVHSLGRRHRHHLSPIACRPICLIIGPFVRWP